MRSIKDINIKNRTYYFYDDMINIRNVDSNFESESLLKPNKRSFKSISIYYIRYITKKDKFAINSVNPLYLIVHEVDDFIEEKERSKYLNFAFIDSNSEVLKKHEEIWSGLKYQIKKINNSKLREYGKDCMKIKFNLDDDLPFNKQLKLINLTIMLELFLKKMVSTILKSS